MKNKILIDELKEIRKHAEKMEDSAQNILTCIEELEDALDLDLGESELDAQKRESKEYWDAIHKKRAEQELKEAKAILKELEEKTDE